MSERDRVSVRAAGVEDVDAIGRIHVDAWRQAYAGLMDDAFLRGLDPGRRAQVWRERLMSGAGSTAVAERAGKVVGFVSYGPAVDADPAESSGQVHAVYVDPPAQRAGVGGALMEYAVAELGAHGFSEAVLWVLEDNPAARAFYERGGWRADGASQSDVFGGRTLRELRYRRPVA